MKKMFLGFLIALISFVVIFLMLILGIRVFFHDDSLSKEEIFGVVNSKYEIIMGDIQKENFKETEKIKGIVSVEDNNGIIDFACEGQGNVVSGASYGFYYTEDDLPKVSFLHVLFTEEDLIPEDNGYCFDKYDYYYTEKIRDKFYYYELHY